MLSIESGLITCGNRIIVPKEMRPEMLQYIHKGHQGKEHCILAQNDLQYPATHREVYHMPGVWKVTSNHSPTQELSPFPWHTFLTDMFYWKRMDFLIVVDVFSKYITVRKFHLCSCVHRAIYDCNRIRPTPHN